MTSKTDYSYTMIGSCRGVKTFFKKRVVFGMCCGLQIKLAEEQLKQREIGNVILLAEKGSHTKELLAVLGLQSVCQMSRKKREVFLTGRTKLSEYVLVGRVQFLRSWECVVPLYCHYFQANFDQVKKKYQLGSHLWIKLICLKKNPYSMQMCAKYKLCKKQLINK